MKLLSSNYDPMDQMTTMDFELESRDELYVTAGWSSNEGEGWSFDILLFSSSVKDYPAQLNSTSLDELRDSMTYLQSSALDTELLDIQNKLEEIKTKQSPSASAKDNYYGI